MKCNYCNKELPKEHEEDDKLMSVCKACFYSYLEALKKWEFASKNGQSKGSPDQVPLNVPVFASNLLKNPTIPNENGQL